MAKRTLLQVIRKLGEALGTEEGKKMRSRLGYLQRIASLRKDWKMLGALTGLIYQLEAYEQMLAAPGLRLPAKRHRAPKVAEGQLALCISETVH